MRSHDSVEPGRVRATGPTLRLLAPSLLALALSTAPVAAQERDPGAPTRTSADTSEPPQATTTPVDAPSEPARTDAGNADAGAATLDADTPPVDPVADVPTDGDSPATQAPPTSDTATQAELDYDALYGAPDTTGADPTSSAMPSSQRTYDPWEPYNRRMHRFNEVVDRTVARPLARTYVSVVPRPMRLGVSNFFNNLGQPASAVNALLQGKPKQAAQSLGRFVINTTLGIGGIFDPASDAKLPQRSEDFGQTLGVWGWKRSRYVELPLFGPRTLRDIMGMFGDAPLSPLRQVEADRVRVPVQGLQLVDIRAQLLSTDSLREGAADDYALLRDAWSQRRHYQIFGDRPAQGDSELPDYLLDEDLPTVPVDAMPVVPAVGG